MDFLLLGPLEVWDDGQRVDVGHARQRCVLAVLAMEAGRVVPAATLIDRVWAHEPPSGPLSTLYTYVRRLRTALEPHGVRLVNRSGGYVLDVAPDAVDVFRFGWLVTDANNAESADQSAVILDRALSLWRGQPFVDIATPWLADICDALMRQRLSALIDRNDAYLRCGRHAELVDELVPIVTAHPTDERPVAQLMLALYRCGRRSEALDQYQHARRRLDALIGSDPSPYLRDLQQQILRDDPRLSPKATANTSSLPVPAGLPHDIAAFVGRRAELAQLDALLPATNTRRAVVISAVDGTAGVGKTALAVHWAHRVKSHFPDGNLYVDLRGYGSGAPASSERVLDGFLATLDVPADRIPVELDAKAALFRSLLDGRSLLIVLDNAASPQQVRHLLPASPGCLVVVTSRRMLGGLVARDHARRVCLDVLPQAEAIALLAQFVGTARTAAEPEAARELALLCACLPIALCVAGERAAAAPATKLKDLVEDLTDRRRRLDLLDADGDPETAVRAVFSWSYHTLSAAAARLFRLLGLHPGPHVSTEAAASLAALAPAAARPLLDELHHAHLIVDIEAVRYAFHDLLRAYAAEQAHHIDTEAQRRATTWRMLDHYLHSAFNADRRLDPARDPITLLAPAPGVTPSSPATEEQALAWFANEHASLLAVIEHAAENDRHTHTWQLAWAVGGFLDRRGHWSDLAATQSAALAGAAELSDLDAMARAHRYLARACHHLRRYDEARSHLQDALDLHSDLGDPLGQAHTHRNLGHLLVKQERIAEGARHLQLAFELYRGAGHQRGQADALNGIAWCHAELGDYEPAVDCCRAALALLQSLGDHQLHAATWDTLGYTHHRQGLHEDAIAAYQSAFALYCDSGDRFLTADTLVHLGDSQHAAGHSGPARRSWQQALTILTDLDHPNAGLARNRLADRADTGHR